MACRSCRRQLTLLGRQTSLLAETSTGRQALLRPAAIPSAFEQRRNFRDTPERQGIMDKVRSAMVQFTEPYTVVDATKTIYTACASQADYTIDPVHIKAGTIPKTEQGEDIGTGKGIWHEDFHLAPTFSTWSQVTMLHMYVTFARLRDLERGAAQAWQRQLVDHFFFDAEERMDVKHGLSSRGLRQRYLKDLFVQWRGLIAAYDEGVVKGDPVLAAAVWRNLFKARPDVDVRALAVVVAWMRRSLHHLDKISGLGLVQLHSAHGDAIANILTKWSPKEEFRKVDMPVPQLEGELKADNPPIEKVPV
ncbi:ubiquinol-cytochrome C chaperone-domain-containing protein [Xylariomycetidae sp. FL0641]|nr:ubiquinol-cytochrome C chaperone-domain-containing protein [Xylariomycetidae sp. FL0641]